VSEELIDSSRVAYLSAGVLLMVVLASGLARRARLGALAGALGVTLLVAATTLDESGTGPLERVLAVILGMLGAAGLMAIAGWRRRRAAAGMPTGRVAGHLPGRGTATALRLWRGELAFGWSLLVLAAWLTAGASPRRW
jgi:MYXO-CTERM domain-containing protein